MQNLVNYLWQPQAVMKNNITTIKPTSDFKIIASIKRVNVTGKKSQGLIKDPAIFIIFGKMMWLKSSKIDSSH
jgi:hypothetical protein